VNEDPADGATVKDRVVHGRDAVAGDVVPDGLIGPTRVAVVGLASMR